ncbi:FAD binding domain-containing protein [Nocardia sp. alder85J]|uniref:FAD binding domain-containing protein n=1 Tax=Nocardia sp. alder85J TaxID=2862949 RepID=UPI001CD3AB28|nr:xanthine dehydrogenase family protein subunit M [Nocardia sp. alder85J]MCX4095664.1 xanthine dehydrogenase family protein subunit M [Nocardia sp. alder85J]
MKPAPFEYARPASISEAIDALASSAGDAKIIAGGQSLIPVLAMRLGRAGLLVDINRIPGLASISRHEDSLFVGALARHQAIAEQQDMPLLAEAAAWIGHTAIRTRGTTGGSIAHADPAAELPVVAAALEATVHVVGPEGERTVGITDLLVGPLENSLAETEIIVGVTYPMPSRWGFAELSRRHGDFGLVTVVAVEVEGKVQLAVGGVGPVPVRPREAEQVLNNAPLSGSVIEEAAALSAAAITPNSDIHGTANYRIAMTKEFTRRALLGLTLSAAKDAG